MYLLSRAVSFIGPTILMPHLWKFWRTDSGSLWVDRRWRWFVRRVTFLTLNAPSHKISCVIGHILPPESICRILTVMRATDSVRVQRRQDSTFLAIVNDYATENVVRIFMQQNAFSNSEVRKRLWLLAYLRRFSSFVIIPGISYPQYKYKCFDSLSIQPCWRTGENPFRRGGRNFWWAGELFDVTISAGGRRTDGGEYISWHRP